MRRRKEGRQKEKKNNRRRVKHVARWSRSSGTHNKSFSCFKNLSVEGYELGDAKGKVNKHKGRTTDGKSLYARGSLGISDGDWVTT